MKKIAFISTNKLLGESLQSSIQTSIPKVEVILLLNPKQVILDAKILEIDVALIDLTFSDNQEINNNIQCLLCEEISLSLPKCHIILLVSQHDKENRKIAFKAKQDHKIDDFVFYDASIKYLVAKLSSI